MNTANSGAVFFLGSRAHYQVLTPPDSNAYDIDIENGNASTETIYQNPSTEIWPNDTTDNRDAWPKETIDNAGIYMYTDNQKNEGVKRRLKKNRKQDGSSELILNDNDDCQDMSVTELNNDGRNNKSKSKRGRVSVSFLLTLLKRRKRMRQGDYAQNANQCTYRNSCRCDDCQSRYFECDDSDYSISEDSDYGQQYAADVNSYANTPVVEEPEELPEEEENDDDEVFIDTPPADTTSTDLLLGPPPRPPPTPASLAIAEQEELALELAAGAPLFLDFLINHPITCAIQ